MFSNISNLRDEIKVLIENLPIYKTKIGFTALNPKGKNIYFKPSNDIIRITQFLNYINPGGRFKNGLPLHRALNKILYLPINRERQIIIFSNNYPANYNIRTKCESYVLKMKQQGKIHILAPIGTTTISENWLKKLSQYGRGNYYSIIYSQRIGLINGESYYINLISGKAFKSNQALSSEKNYNRLNELINSGYADPIPISLNPNQPVYLPQVISILKNRLLHQKKSLKIAKIYPHENNLSFLLQNLFLKTSSKRNSYLHKKFFIQDLSNSMWIRCYNSQNCLELDSISKNRYFYLGLSFIHQFYSKSTITPDPNNIHIWAENYPPPRFLTVNLNKIYTKPSSLIKSGFGLPPIWFFKVKISQSISGESADIWDE